MYCLIDLLNHNAICLEKCSKQALISRFDICRRNFLNKLVTSPLQNYCHLTGRDWYLTTHLDKNYHENSCYEATQLVKVAAGIETSTYSQLNHAAKRVKQKNRAILERILEAIAFFGHCGLPLRDHRDSGHPSTSTLDQSVGSNG